jgi:hypothetical protein
MRRLIFDGGYLQSHFREALGLTECVDPPEKPVGVHDALHQKALREARKSLWDALTSNDYIYDFIAEEFARHYEGALAGLSLNISGALYNAPGTLAPWGIFLPAPGASVRRSQSVGLIVGWRNSELERPLGSSAYAIGRRPLSPPYCID